MEEDKVKFDVSPIVEGMTSVLEDISLAVDKYSNNEPINSYEKILLSNLPLLNWSLKRLLKKEKNMEDNKLDFNFYISKNEAALIIAALENLLDLYDEMQYAVIFDEDCYGIISDKKEIIDNMISTFSDYIEEEG